LVQTRKSDEKVFEYGLKGNMIDFYRNTIEERKKFNYPPFTKLIKITLEGKKEEIVKEMEQAQNILDPYEVEVFPAFTHTVKGNFVLHGLLRINNNEWPKQDLIDKIKQLSPAITVKVDPDSLL
jgi:primosomal protein N'